MTADLITLAGVFVVCIGVLIWEAFDLGGWLKRRQLRRKIAEHEACEGRARKLEDFSRRWRAERFEREALKGISEIPVAEPVRRRVR